MADNRKEQERAELHRGIWNIANDLRGSVYGGDFKEYVLGILFYRYISENLTAYVNHRKRECGEKNFNYAKISDEQAEEIRNEMVELKGFFILPSELFANVCASSQNNSNINETLEHIFKHIETSSQGSKSEKKFKGLFDDIDVNSKKLGETLGERNKKLKKLLSGIQSMQLVSNRNTILDFQQEKENYNFKDNIIDAFGDAYEFLMSIVQVKVVVNFTHRKKFPSFWLKLRSLAKQK